MLVLVDWLQAFSRYATKLAYEMSLVPLWQSGCTLLVKLLIFPVRIRL